MIKYVIFLFVLVIFAVLFISNVNKHQKSRDKEKAYTNDKKRKSPTTEPPTRYSLVKDVAKSFASWKNSNNEDCYVYVMPSRHYNGVFILEMSVKKRYWELNFSKNYIDNYDSAYSN